MSCYVCLIFPNRESDDIDMSKPALCYMLISRTTISYYHLDPPSSFILLLPRQPALLCISIPVSTAVTTILDFVFRPRGVLLFEIESPHSCNKQSWERERKPRQLLNIHFSKGKHCKTGRGIFFSYPSKRNLQCCGKLREILKRIYSYIHTTAWNFAMEGWV